MKSKKYDNAHFYNAIIDELKTNSPRIFKVNPSNILDISITAQRRRALSLAWALVTSGKVKDGSTVCVIGAGFSGTAVACTLTLLCKCIVYLIDKESKPLGKFKNANYRYISKNLNINGSSDGQSNNFYPDEIPLFQWQEGLVKDVINEWRQEYYLIARQRPIIELMGVECHNFEPKGKRRVNISLKIFQGSDTPKFEKSTLSADLVVLATGFGEETNKYGFKDYSYWNSGYPSYYQPTKKRERVLISGGGDSGLTEVLHYLLSEFEHELIQNYRISENYCQEGLETFLETLEYGELFSNIRGYDEPSESIYWY